MMSITLQKSSSDEQYWKEHLGKQKKSGLPVSVYCREHELNYDRFYYWVRKEKRVTPRLIPIEIQSVAAEKFSSVPMEAPVLCTLPLRSGSVLAIHDQGIIPLVLSAVR